MVGIPGSGKSTLAAKLEKAGYLRLSADSIRKELYGSESVQGDGNVVWGLFQRRFRKAVREKLAIVIDNTNVLREHRRRLIRWARFYGYQVDLWVMCTPLETAIAQNNQRDRVVPESVIRKYHNTLIDQFPEESEGRVIKFRCQKCVSNGSQMKSCQSSQNS